MKKKFYITTAIDYVNDTIHIGHAFQKIAADVLARFYRIKLGKKNVFFLTGTDEYGQKAQKAAEEAKLPTIRFVDKIAKSDQEQQDALNISYDRFIRTTDEDHKKVVQEIWRRTYLGGDIYLGEYIGLYCEGCEGYYTKSDLVRGRCSFHPSLKIKEITEKNYFFRWSRYKDYLINHIKNNPRFVIPEVRKNEILEFVKNIKDIPISRTRVAWGIKVPNNPRHVIYVWFDALINYLTGVGFLKNPKLFEKFWPADIHILGKDNVRWHALLWPAMLKSVGIEPPKTILVNGFLNLDGQKISKSLGNIVRPTDWVAKYEVDAVRYYLLRYTTLAEDSDISEKKLIRIYNSDLANGLGNLIARVATLCEKNSVQVSDARLGFYSDVEKCISAFRLNEAVDCIWSEISKADKKISEEKPWKLSSKKAKVVLEDLVQRIRQVAFNLQPFLPETAEKIQKQFIGPKIKKAPSLFPRI
ncbi:methionine--tRNA ligase [Candidatus Curtissbacteria bacterium RBG_16_39_7]|uniref:Methionine--tRNA ligase n=1 Tax=Candidatus Curtissbacteria bacterium RBG_16_39_7 TaxID=1797707 RepID=A0A1F5G389_9BACT|nr:MAG: methionine--tRNA ligase [Candidatus Curtissbacteria bacterium RBG_16_39_7]